MAQITQDGFTFDSDWIDANAAKYRDESVIWAVRYESLRQEITMREEDLKLMLQTMPVDLAGHAHSRAYLAVLWQVAEDLSTENV
jgi:hypothetical protein